MSEDDDRDERIAGAFAAWRVATGELQPRAELLARIGAATRGASPSLAASLWRMGSRAALALAVAAALLFVVAQRSVARLEDRVAVNVEALLP